MPTTFANTIDGNPIYAARSTADKDGNQIDTTYAKSASLATVATSGDYDDLSNKPTIPAAQVNSDWDASSGVAQILNKPSLATVATSGSYTDLSNKPSIPSATSDLTNDSGFITSSDVPAAQAQADWNETNTSDPSYIQNKPTIPAAQVNSDWNASSGVAQILNKPSLATVATSGDYDDLQNKPTIPAAQVNSDWNASSGLAEILNKPTLATVATTGAYSDLTGTPTIPDGVPTVTSYDDGKVLTAAYSGGVGSYAWATAGGGSSNVEIVDETDISTRFPTYNDLATEIANGKYFIIKSTTALTSTTGYYCLAAVQTTSVTFAYASTADGKVSYNWTLTIFNYNGLPSVSKRSWSSDSFKHNEWIDINFSQYVPLGTYTEGYILAVPTSSATIYLYKCILGYTESSSSVLPGGDTTHWQRTYLQDILNSASSFTQVQANWTESDNTSPAYIQNKPSLATVATTGSYNDLSNTPTIPDGVPPVTSSDDGKVLTADYTGGVASYSWETPSGGSSTYKFLQINDEPGTHDDDVGTFVNANIGTGPIVVRFKYSYDSGFSYYEEDYVVQYCLDKMDSNNPYPYFTLVGATNNNGNIQVYTYSPEVSGDDVSYTSSLKTVKAEYSGATIVDYDTYSYTPYDNLFNYFQASGENSAKNLFINVNASSMSAADKAALFGSSYSSYSALILTNGYALLDSNSDVYGIKFCGIFNNYDNSAKYLVTASFIYNGQIIPTKTLTVEAITSGGSTELFEAVYGTTTYADIQAAVRNKKIVYCRVSASSPTRMAFLAYIGTNNYEFQYYRSLSSHSYTNQVDEVYIYKVDSNGWTTTTRTTGPRVVAGTNMNYTYSSDTLTLNAPASGNMLSVTNNTMNVTTTAGITDIQKVSALPANPVSTVLYLIEE